jgi:hypothetical protein
MAQNLIGFGRRAGEFISPVFFAVINKTNELSFITYKKP